MTLGTTLVHDPLNLGVMIHGVCRQAAMKISRVTVLVFILKTCCNSSGTCGSVMRN